MELLEFPINHNHIQNRVDGFKDWLYQLSPEQLDSVMCDIEQYLLDCASNMENQDIDSMDAVQAAVRVSESRWWIAHLY